MPIFAVMLRGENFEIVKDGTLKRLGFYATRHVRSQNEAEAEKAAIAMVRADRDLRSTTNRDSKHVPMIFLESIKRLSWWHMIKPPKGFSFWDMEEEERSVPVNAPFDADAQTRRST